MTQMLLKPIGVSLWMGLLVAAGLFFGAGDYFKDQELAVYDEETRTRPKTEVKFSPKIVLIEINNQSVHSTDRFPWSEGKIASLLSNIRKAKPKAIVLDLPLLRPRTAEVRAQLQKALAAFEKLHPKPAAPTANPKAKKRRRRLSRRQKAELAQRKALQARIEILRKQLQASLKDPGHQRLLKEIKATKNLVLAYNFYKEEGDVPGIDGRYYKKKQMDARARKRAKSTPARPAPRRKAPAKKATKKGAKGKKPAAKKPAPRPAAKAKKGPPPAIELFQIKRTQLLNGTSAKDPALNVGFMRESPEFAPHARFHGFTNLFIPKQYVQRTARLVVRKDKKVYPSLALAGVIAFGDKNPAMQINDSGYLAIDLQSHIIPLTKSGKVWVYYYGPRTAIPKEQRLLAGDVIAGKNYAASDIAGKLVFVGISSSPMARTLRTPHHSLYSALEVHATVASNLLQGNTIKRTKSQGFIELGMLILLSLLLGALSMKLRYFGGFIALVLLIAALRFANHFFLFPNGDWFQLLHVQFGLVVVFLGISLVRRASGDKQLAETRSRFQPRMNEEDFQRVVKKPKELQLDGAWRPLTVLTGHVTPLGMHLSDENNPKQITKLLPHLINPMATAICRNKGTVGKLDGHGFQGLFNAPFDLATHPENACLAALQMRSECEPFLSQWQLEGLPTPTFGIGIDTGHAVTGNLGGEQRFHYSAVGAPVEYSAEIEQLNRIYGSQILLSEAIVAQVQPTGRFVIRELDKVRMDDNDQSEPITLYELLGQAPANTPIKEAVEWYQHGLTYYRARNFQEAVRYFQEILRVRPDDGPAKTMLARSQHLLHYPPSFQWDGTHKLK